jgi:hypothetical protein
VFLVVYPLPSPFHSQACLACLRSRRPRRAS